MQFIVRKIMRIGRIVFGWMLLASSMTPFAFAVSDPGILTLQEEFKTFRGYLAQERQHRNDLQSELDKAMNRIAQLEQERKPLLLIREDENRIKLPAHSTVFIHTASFPLENDLFLDLRASGSVDKGALAPDQLYHVFAIAEGGVLRLIASLNKDFPVGKDPAIQLVGRFITDSKTHVAAAYGVRNKGALAVLEKTYENAAIDADPTKQCRVSNQGNKFARYVCDTASHTILNERVTPGIWEVTFYYHLGQLHPQSTLRRVHTSVTLGPQITLLKGGIQAKSGGQILPRVYMLQDFYPGAIGGNIMVSETPRILIKVTGTSNVSIQQQVSWLAQITGKVGFRGEYKLGLVKVADLSDTSL
jgi:hypothetical protein